MSTPRADEIHTSSKNALKAVYYVIIGLAIKEALNRIFVKNGSFVGFQIFNSSNLPCTILFIALMPTICRFVHGASIHLDILPERKSKTLFDFISFFVQSSFFYIMSITLDKTFAFLVLFSLILLFDACWLLVLKKVKYIEFDSTERQWLKSDVGMIICFVILYGLYAFKILPYIALVSYIAIIAILATIIDYDKNRDFYFPG